jgi:formyltetrahydrofolate deformylase
VSPEHVLTLSCPDRRGVVHAVASYLLTCGGNILDSQQFYDSATGLFFMRVHFSTEDADPDVIAAGFEAVARNFRMTWELHDPARKARVLVLVSKFGHCLNDLLFRAHSGQLKVDIAAVASNHEDFTAMAGSYGIPFHHLPVNADNRAVQEQQLIDLVEREKIDLVVLARYMQILSPRLCEALAGRAINIHHSFLPSFKGAQPYHQAHARGVKIIGATAHYVTSDLDEGPIIEQDVARVDHAMTPRDLVRLGSDTESQVLARAVRRHVEHRIILNGHRTVVFR